jgi:hypothetical protein
MQLSNPRNSENEKIRDIIDTMFNTVKDQSNHKLGVLYNSFTEGSFGPRLKNYTAFDSIHADSGGLQIVTKGETVTPEIKTAIYKNQAASADMGMCFDEIPVQLAGEKSGRNDTKNRYFDNKKLEFYARETGKNLKEQIETFLAEKSNCKPILIAQGNCYDSYMKWVELILDEIPTELHDHIGGTAVGAAALGTGSLEDIERAYLFSQFPEVIQKHLHILGIGSTKRLLPYLIFMQNGMYKETTSVSYDSTTHTSGVALGLYYNRNWKSIKFNRNYSKTYQEAFEDMKQFINLDGYDDRELHKCMNMSALTYFEENKENGPEIFATMVMGFIMSSIRNFITHVDTVMSDKKELLKVAQKAKFYTPAKFLFEVNNKDAYDKWYGNFRSHIPSRRVAANPPSTLEDFF